MSMSPLRVVRRETAAPAASATSQTSQPKPSSVEQLSADDARALSIETINMLVKENPSLVARLITDAGKRARGELPTAPLSSLHPTARAAILSGEKARGRTLNAEEAEFLAAYVEEHWPS
jgi:hypothetical protein